MAIARQDRAQWEATIDSEAPDRASELAAYDSIVRLGVRSLTVVDASGPLRVSPSLGAGGPTSGWQRSVWQVTVSLSYRLPGADRADRPVRRTVTLAADSTGWHVLRWLGPTDRWELWDLPGVSVVRTDRVLVVGDAPLPTLIDRAAESDVALARVGGVLGGAPRIVVVVPSIEATAARLAGWSTDALGQVAASTIGDRQTGQPAGADRVVLNPRAWAVLTPAGRAVVLTHEVAHAVMRATSTQDVPAWLSEGLADWIAYRDSGLEHRVVARQALDRVRASGPPESLPMDADLDLAHPGVVASYQAAWLAVAWIERERGSPALLAFYRALAIPAASAGATVGPADLTARTDAAFVEHLGLTRQQFVAQWRAELVSLAHG